jgi:glycosyltransferase involved in cell wall biosynthesis
MATELETMTTQEAPSPLGQAKAKEPLVTVAVPVYNGERTLCNAIESIQAQTYLNLEIVVCDNGSTDGTHKLCRHYANQDPRVRYYRNSENIGQTRNFQRALELATGEYFMWSCADDARPRNAIKHLVKALVENPDSVMAHGPVIAKGTDFEIEVSNEMDLMSPSAAARIRAFTRGIRHNSMIHGLYRRSVLKDVILGAHYGQDYLFCLQVCHIGPVQYIRHPMIIFHERGSRPSIDPMGQQNLTFRSVVARRGTKRKCLTVLLIGSRYLLKRRDIPFRQRVEAVAAHLSNFCLVYRRGLVMDAVSFFMRPLSGPPQWTGS